MQAVYRRARFALLLLLAAGCRPGAPGEPAPPAPPPRRDALASLLESFEVTPAPYPAAERPRFGTLRSSEATRAVRLDDAAPIAGLPEPSTALVQLGADRALIAARGRLFLVAPEGAPRALSAPAPGALRVLASGAGAAWLAERTDLGERLIRIDSAGAWRERARLPPGLTARVASRDGMRVALRRRDAEGDLLFLHEVAEGTTRLQLPDDRPGHFEPFAFADDGSRLLLLSDDRSPFPVVEWLELATGARTALETPAGCAALGAHLAPGGAVAVSLSCGGRGGLRLHQAGAERLLPTPSGGRAVAAWPDGSEGWIYAVAAPRHPRDLWRTAANDDARPVTYGLGPRIAAADLVDPEPAEVATPWGELPAELWRPRLASGERPLLGIVWLDRDDRPSRWFEFDALPQFLAQQGVAILRLRLPEGAGPAGTSAGPAPDPFALLESAARTLELRASLAGRSLALVAEGRRPAALALAAAARGARFAAIAALDAAPEWRTLLPGGARVPLLVAAAAAPAPPPDVPQAEPQPALPSLANVVWIDGAALGPETHALPAEVAVTLWRHLAKALAENR